MPKNNKKKKQVEEDEMEIEEEKFDAKESLQQAVECVSQFDLESIPSSWISELWGDQKKKKKAVRTDDDPESEYNLEAISAEYLLSLLSCLEQLVENQSRGFFRHISEQEIDHRSLITLLAKLLGQRQKENIKIAFLAGHVYLSLLCLEGSKMAEIFHPTVVCFVFELLRDYPIYCRIPEGKRKKPKKEEGDEIEEEEDDGTVEDTQLLAMIVSLLGTVQKFLSLFALSKHQECVGTAISAFSEIARYNLFAGHSKEELKRINKNKVLNFVDEANPVELSVTCLKQLLSPDHGDVSEIFQIVLSSLAPNILLDFGTVSATIQKHKLLTRQYSLKFVLLVFNYENYLIISHSHLETCWAERDALEIEDFDFYEYIEMLMQHIALNVPEKGAYKTLACDSIVQIFEKVPSELQKSFSGWLRVLSKNAKSSHRAFSVEVSCLIFEHLSKSLPNKNAYEICSSALTVLSERCSDAVMAVRAKSLTLLAHILKNATGEKAEEVVREELLEGDTLENTLRKRAQDVKGSVRKAALLALEALSSWTSKGGSMSSGDVQLFSRLCQDASVATRRQGIHSVTEILKSEPSRPDLVRVWLGAVLPRAMDSETSVQQKAVDAIDEILFQRIVAATKKGAEDTSVWYMVSQLGDDSLRCLQHVCHQLLSKKKIPTSLISALQKTIRKEGEHVSKCWVLLAELAPHFPEEIDVLLVLAIWKENACGRDAKFLPLVLRILSSCSKLLEAQDLEDLEEQLFNALQQFNLPTLLVQSYLEALVSFCHALEESDKRAKQRVGKLCSVLLSACDSRLSEFVVSKQGLSDEQLLAFLFTAGASAQASFASLPPRLATTVQTLVSPSHDKEESYLVSPNIRAIAFITLGKLCLEDEKLAKQYSAVFARELEVSQFPIIRNNIVFIMCDVCKKFSGVVEPYLSNLCACLRDPSVLVRKQTLLLLSHLLQENFLKWKPILFYRILSATIDECDEVAHAAISCLRGISQLKNAGPGALFASHFVESVFHLNDYLQHPSYNKFQQTIRERQLFSLKGDENRGLRMRVYEILLEPLDDEQKFNTSSKLCSDILAAIVDEKIAFKSATDLLVDTLLILASKKIKLSASFKKKQPVDESDQEENMEAVKGKLLSKVSPKTKYTLLLIFLFFHLFAAVQEECSGKHRPCSRELEAPTGEAQISNSPPTYALFQGPDEGAQVRDQPDPRRRPPAGRRTPV